MMLMLSGMLTAQTVDNPPFKARSGSIGNITRIERTPDGTRVYIHAIFRPHWWIKEEGDSYLEDAATGKKYQFKSAEGIELNKEVYMPDSGEMDYVLVFEALPEETQVIHLLSPVLRQKRFAVDGNQGKLVQGRRLERLGIRHLRFCHDYGQPDIYQRKHP